MADGDNKVYVFDDGANKHEGMTKSEIMDTIVEMMETGQVTGGIYIDAVKEQNAGESLKFWVGTQAQYEALPEIDPYIDYKITDANTLQEIDAALTQLKEQLTSGAFKVKSAYTADDVQTSINGKAISEIFESDGKTAKKATIATADENGNNIMASYALKDDLQDAEGDIDALEGRMTTAEGDIDALEAEQQTNAKLSQVVRVDAAQSLTDAQKNTVARNIERSAGRTVNSGGVGWYNILTADISGYFVADLSVTSNYSHSEPTEVKIVAIGGYTVSGLAATRVSITCFSAGALLPFVSKVRVRSIEGQICIDIYIPFSTTLYFNDMQVTLNSWKAADDITPQVQPFTFVGTEDGAGNVSICEVIPKGISTNGQIYQQGAPVFATDPSKLVPSTANGWTQTTATGALPSAGAYLCYWTSGDARTGLSLLVFDGTNNALAVVPQIYDGEYTSQVLMYEANTENSRWTVRSGQSVAALSRVYYKRIA